MGVSWHTKKEARKAISAPKQRRQNGPVMTWEILFIFAWKKNQLASVMLLLFEATLLQLHQKCRIHVKGFIMWSEEYGKRKRTWLLWVNTFKNVLPCPSKSNFLLCCYFRVLDVHVSLAGTVPEVSGEALERLRCTGCRQMSPCSSDPQRDLWVLRRFGCLQLGPLPI